MREGYKFAKGEVQTAASLVAEDAERRRCAITSSAARSAPSTKRQVVPKSAAPARLPRSHRAPRHRLRRRPRRHRQDLPRDGPGGVVPAVEARQPHHPGAPGGRGRREARLPARRSAGEGEPLPASALRRALRHARGRSRRAAARARHDRDRADCVHARPHAERRVRDPGRGAEHDVGADEDVPDPPRLRIEGGDHRRRHADRSAARPRLRPDRGAERRPPHRGHRRSSTSTIATSSATAWCSASCWPTRSSPAAARRRRRRGSTDAVRHGSRRHRLDSKPGSGARRSRRADRCRDNDCTCRYATPGGVRCRRPRRSPRWLARVAPARLRGPSTIAFVGDARMRTLNRTWRGVDSATDVLSFPRPGERGTSISATSSSPPASRRGRRARPGMPRRPSGACWRCTDCCTSLGYDHERDAGEMARVEARLRERAAWRRG